MQKGLAFRDVEVFRFLRNRAIEGSRPGPRRFIGAQNYGSGSTSFSVPERRVPPDPVLRGSSSGDAGAEAD
jgi:hypothetical protein